MVRFRPQPPHDQRVVLQLMRYKPIHREGWHRPRAQTRSCFTMRVSALLLILFTVTVAVPVSAQAPTGTAAGHVVSADGQPLPGVTVSATSANLQCNRITVTSENGDYIIPLLPPGQYTL